MRTIKIGRSHTNDCVLDNQTVSRTHAVIDVDADEQHGRLRDLNSTHGTYVNGKRITAEVMVSCSDTLRFGSETITLGGILAKANKTVIRKTDAGSLPGVERRTIGKSGDNNIILNHDDVSRRHAIIYKEANGNVVIEDLNSTNGIYVNGIKITSQVLHVGDKVTITRNYNLAWENIFKPAAPSPTPMVQKLIRVAAVIVACLVLGGGAYYGYMRFSKWDKEKIYKEYHSAVCWVYVQYGYKVFVDNEDFTPVLCHCANIEDKGFVYIDGDDLLAGSTASQGTAFFISDDGKLATNLHISRPWLFSDDKEKLEELANKLLSLLATENPMLSRSKVEAKCILQGMYVVPDGLPVSESNLVECEEIKGHDDTNKDVAVLQTKTRRLPAGVKRVIDINDSDTSEEALTEGRTLFTIGFPYGADIAQDSHRDLKNQVHGGSVTQNKGEYEFGHDAETASGASGSPILNDKGRLIGVHHAGVTGSQGFNYAIKVKYLIDLIK